MLYLVCVRHALRSVARLRGAVSIMVLMGLAYGAQAVATTSQSAGFALQCAQNYPIAILRNYYLDAANAEVAKLRRGFTLTVWLKYEALSLAHSPYPVSLIHALDINFVQPFGPTSSYTGFFLGSAAPATVSHVANRYAWHHYAVSFNASSGVGQSYVDGLPIANVLRSNAVIPIDTQNFVMSACQAILVTPANDYAHVNHGINLFEGTIDDIALFSRELSPHEVAARWNSSLTDRISSEPDLLLFYNFNNATAWSDGYVPNLGTAGSPGHDLVLGMLPTTGEEFRYHVIDDSVSETKLVPVAKPALIPAWDSHAPAKPKDMPLVRTATANESVVFVAADGTEFEVTAPINFTSTWSNVVDVNGVATEVTLIPMTPPVFTAPLSVTTLTLLEDSILNCRFWFASYQGLPLSLIITSLPEQGVLYRLSNGPDENDRDSPIVQVGDIVNTSSYGKVLMFVPGTDGHGQGYANFRLRAVVVDHPDLLSPEVTFTFNVLPMNDLPTATSSNLALIEDKNPLGAIVNLTYADAESVADAVLTELPSKGTLYVSSDHAMHPITAAYNWIDLGSGIREQYLAEVIRVSSFWGAPPFVSYHPLTVLGPPDCSTPGECQTDKPWTTSPTSYPEIGDRVLYPVGGLLAFVNSTSPSNGKVTIEFAKVCAGKCLIICACDQRYQCLLLSCCADVEGRPAMPHRRCIRPYLSSRLPLHKRAVERQRPDCC